RMHGRANNGGADILDDSGNGPRCGIACTRLARSPTRLVRGAAISRGGFSDEGSLLTVQDFARILRTRWVVVFGAIVIAVLAAVAYGAVAPKQYEASTRLFVSTTSDGTNTQNNDGGLFAQRRVLPYHQLLPSARPAHHTT